jgi:hypothetical protein
LNPPHFQRRSAKFRILLILLDVRVGFALQSSRQIDWRHKRGFISKFRFKEVVIMVENSCCSFCEQLPSIARPGRGSPSKCPLCKQALWSSPDGTTHRLESTSAPASPGKWLGLAGLGVALLAGLGVMLSFYVVNRSKPIGTPSAFGEPAPSVNRDAESPLPSARAKPGWGVAEVRVKPIEPPVVTAPIVEAKSAVKPVPVTYFQDAPTVKAIAPRVAVSGPAQEQFEKLLRDVPMVDLDPLYAKKTKAQLAEAAAQIRKDTEKEKDGFVHKLRKERADLAGLPFLLGKDCTISEKDAKSLGRGATIVRITMAADARSISPRSISETSEDQRAMAEQADPRAVAFWSQIGSEELEKRWKRNGDLIFEKGWTFPDVTPALQQIMMAENKDHRLLFTANLKTKKGANSTSLLARFALYDVNPDVRRLALEALRERPQKDYQPILMKAFRYPWAPVVQNAAHAVVTLELKNAIPELKALLDQPDPTAPFTVRNEGEIPKQMMRELVRVNHHRNCLLCHAPLSAQTVRASRDLPIGPVTSAADPLPPGSSDVYYAERRGVTLVRADITYLRQDFSLQQKVEDPGHWPEMQRFDFFVRTRELTEEEKIEKRKVGARPEFREAIATALRALTDRDHPMSAAQAMLPGMSKGPPEKSGR